MHVLLVDDSALMMRALKRACEKQGHCLSVASDAIEAMEILQRQGIHAARKPIDVAFVDLHLGAKSGIDLAQEIKSDPTLVHIPIVILSVTKSREQVLAGYKAGIATWISKVTISELENLATVLNYWELSEREKA